jgi:hypothetical protein
MALEQKTLPPHTSDPAFEDLNTVAPNNELLSVTLPIKTALDNVGVEAKIEEATHGRVANVSSWVERPTLNMSSASSNTKS